MAVMVPVLSWATRSRNCGFEKSGRRIDRELPAAGNQTTRLQAPLLSTGHLRLDVKVESNCPTRTQRYKSRREPKILDLFLFFLTMSMAFILESRNKPFIACSGPRG